MLIDAFSVLCAQPTRDLLAIAKFLLNFSAVSVALCRGTVERLNVPGLHDIVSAKVNSSKL